MFKLSKFKQLHSRNNLFSNIIKKNFFKKLSFLGDEISIYNRKIDENEIMKIENFNKQILNYNLKTDFKCDKESILISRNQNIQFPFVLYKSSSKLGLFVFYLFIFSMSSFYLVRYFLNKFYFKKYNTIYAMKYVAMHLVGLMVVMRLMRSHMKIIKKIELLNFNSEKFSNEKNIKNLNIHLFSGKVLKENIPSLWIDKLRILSQTDNPYIYLNIKDKEYYLHLKNSRIYDRALFMSIIRGYDFKTNL